MKILIIGPAHPFRGGISDFNESLAKSLIDRKHEVEILSFKKQYPRLLFPGKTQKRNHEIQHSFPIHSLIHSYRPFNWYRLRKWIEKLQPELIIVRYWTPFMAPCLGTILGGIKKKVPVLSITDNVVPHEKGKSDRFLTQYFVKKISGFITLSESVAQDLKTFGHIAPIITTPHPIYDHFGSKMNVAKAREKLNIPSHEKVVLFFGLVRAYKGLDLLLEALLTKVMKEMNVKLLLAGEFYDKREKYQPYLDQLKDENRLFLFDHFIPDDEVATYFSAADLVTQTYHSATQSGVTQIAYHFNTPILVTNVGGLPEMVPHKKVGYVVDKNPTVIAEMIADFFVNERAEVFKNGIEIEKEKYSWTKMVDVIEALYGEIKSK